MRWVYLSLSIATVGAAFRWGWGRVGLTVFAASRIVGALVIGFLWVADSAPPDPDRQRVILGAIADEPGMYVLGVDLTEDGSIDLVKIGMSGVSMSDRAKTLQTSAFAPLWPVASYPTPAPEGTPEDLKAAVARQQAYALESDWHSKYRTLHEQDDRMGSEWFRVEGALEADLIREGASLDTRYLE